MYIGYTVNVKGIGPGRGDQMPEAGEQVPLPPGLDLLWGRREQGKRGPRAGLSADAIVAAAVGIADAEGLEAVSMARVAKKLRFKARQSGTQVY